jgi:alcohol dehydrogenase
LSGDRAANRRHFGRTTGLVGTYSTWTLMRLAASRQPPDRPQEAHHPPFRFDRFPEAYDVSADAAGTGALKVVMTRRQ